MVRVLILNGSFRRGQNTDTLLLPMVEELEGAGVQVHTIYLCEQRIGPCMGCYTCQDIFDGYGCVQRDDMYSVADELQACDAFLLATPIYSWYCTAPMKAVLDRHYGMNKFYGSRPGPSLWAGKQCGIVATCGYEIPYGTEPFETGIKRLCEHSDLRYIGMLAERDLDDKASFETPQAIEKARMFGKHVLSCLKGETEKPLYLG